MKLKEEDKEIRNITKNGKENEEKYILKTLEDKDKYAQKIVRLELELAAINKDSDPQKDNKKVTKVIPVESEIKKPLININELIYTIEWFRIVVIRSGKTWNDIKEDIFSVYKATEKISIKELTKVFQRKPFKLKLTDGEDLARYLVEPKGEKEIGYNVYRDKLVAESRIILDSVLSISLDYKESIKKATENDV